MMISTKGRYALRVMIDLAEHNSGASIPLADIADRQEISEKYLESIVAVLSREGLVAGIRGKGGGYRLTRPPETYRVGDILRLVDGSLAPVSCLDSGESLCTRADRCKTLPMWSCLNQLVLAYFSAITLADLLLGELPDCTSEAIALLKAASIAAKPDNDVITPGDLSHP